MLLFLKEAPARRGVASSERGHPQGGGRIGLGGGGVGGGGGHFSPGRAPPRPHTAGAGSAPQAHPGPRSTPRATETTARPPRKTWSRPRGRGVAQQRPTGARCDQDLDQILVDSGVKLAPFWAPPAAPGCSQRSCGACFRNLDSYWRNYKKHNVFVFFVLRIFVFFRCFSFCFCFCVFVACGHVSLLLLCQSKCVFLSPLSKTPNLRTVSAFDLLVFAMSVQKEFGLSLLVI